MISYMSQLALINTELYAAQASSPYYRNSFCAAAVLIHFNISLLEDTENESSSLKVKSYRILQVINNS